MRILHTSDWHLGRALYNKKRFDEFEAFLGWLIRFISDEKIDVLLIAGDVFDSSNPPTQAQELYYRFLGQIAGTGCRHVVIIGGNHDSPSFLEAPKQILSVLNIRVVGCMQENPEDEVFLLRDVSGKPEAVVCAVPFLRDKDVRLVEPGESADDKVKKLLDGISNHYNAALDAALSIRVELGADIPVIGMGHLFTRGGITSEGDGIRELYIGSLAHVDGDTIAKGFDYMALGHLHLPQKAGKSDIVRYSGSPLQMGFNEAGHKKKVLIAEFTGSSVSVTDHDVPRYRRLVSYKGTLEEVSNQLTSLVNKDEEAWVEVEITAFEPAAVIKATLDAITDGTRVEVLKTKNMATSLSGLQKSEHLAEPGSLDPMEVFERCLDDHDIMDEKREAYKETYREVIHMIINADKEL